jgi:hypothetical protein
MTVSSYYRLALLVPILFPASIGVVGLVINTFFEHDETYLIMAAVLSVPLPAYVPMALWIGWKIKRRELSESDLSRVAMTTPLVVALIGAVVTLLFGSLIQGAVVIAALFLCFGYIYVGAIELGRAIGSRVGWLVTNSLERPS